MTISYSMPVARKFANVSVKISCGCLQQRLKTCVLRSNISSFLSAYLEVSCARIRLDKTMAVDCNCSLPDLARKSTLDTYLLLIASFVAFICDLFQIKLHVCVLRWTVTTVKFALSSAPEVWCIPFHNRVNFGYLWLSSVRWLLFHFQWTQGASNLNSNIIQSPHRVSCPQSMLFREGKRVQYSFCQAYCLFE